MSLNNAAHTQELCVTQFCVTCVSSKTTIPGAGDLCPGDFYMCAIRPPVALQTENKYAIYAYTHGPVTGSGPSVKPLKYDVAPYWLS